MNKKAGFAQPIIDFYAVIVIVAIIMIFLLVLKLHSSNLEVAIKSDIDSIDGTMMLANYVKAPISYNGQEMTIAEYIDLINPSSLDKKLQAGLEKRTREYFHDYEEGAGCSVLLTVHYGNEKLPLPSTKSADRCKPSAVQRIPTISGRQITVSMEGGK